MKKEESALSPADQEFANALKDLRPAASSLNRDELMYELGRRAVGKQLQWWKGVSVVLGLFLCLAGFQSLSLGPVARKPRPELAESTQAQEPRAPNAELSLLTQSTMAGSDYLRLRRMIELLGADVLPESSYLPISIPAVWKQSDRSDMRPFPRWFSRLTSAAEGKNPL